MLTVLVADDDPDTAELVRHSLLAAGHHVLVAHDGGEALALAPEVDLAVLDVEMPVLDGHAVVGRLRSDARTCDLPVLMLSSRSSAEDINAGLLAGADDYLTKPVVPFELRRRVDHLVASTGVERRAARRQEALRREVLSA